MQVLGSYALEKYQTEKFEPIIYDIYHNKEEDNFERPFSFFYDYPADQQLIGQTLQTAKEVIFERITQDVFNASLAKW